MLCAAVVAATCCCYCCYCCYCHCYLDFFAAVVLVLALVFALLPKIVTLFALSSLLLVAAAASAVAFASSVANVR